MLPLCWGLKVEKFAQEVKGAGHLLVEPFCRVLGDSVVDLEKKAQFIIRCVCLERSRWLMSNGAPAHFPFIVREAYHHQHCDQVIISCIFLKNIVQRLHVPGPRLGVSPGNITCIHEIKGSS